ncbi:SPOR domain-containing protein [Halopseudomonas sp.]|uniref:SPOR domain-containing protein n=1 Tax=Halopseudomonas sp. TaxID=2901191 RepID=UPI003565FD13
MRSVLLFLLLLNVLYALWQLQDDRAVQALYETADESLEPLSPDIAPPELVRQVGSQPTEDSSRLCVNLGVFSTPGKAEQLRQRLLALSVQSEVISRDVADTLDYWLVLPVEGGEREAISQLNLLQGQGIDSFLITQGPLAGNISLGVFSREEYAAARQAQLQAQGYSVEVEMLEKTSVEYLVQVDAEARRLVDQSMLARLRDSFPDLQHQFDPCQPVAN